MNRWSRTAAILVCSLVLSQNGPAIAQAPTAPTPPTLDGLGFIPKPRQVTLNGSTYTVPSTVVIAAQSSDERNVADLLQAFLAARGVHASVGTMISGSAPIRLTIHNVDPLIGAEGYRLKVDATGVSVTANTGAGLFYGVQTLEQLFPARASDGNTLTGVTVDDWPAYSWRGIHLDVSRHFFPVAVVERYIDLAARYKLNTFHWHLTDDQGWRIAIAHYPRLTQVGSCRAGTEVGHDDTQTDGKRYCGYYTQDQIRQVVAYARRRYVTILPEIEMPGHSVAALVAYPQLACAPGAFKVRETWGVSTDIACPTERTFTFFQTILDEVMALFPGRYVHIGGDEVPKDAWKRSPFVNALMKQHHLASYDAVQGYFTRRIEQYLNARGRKMIGWDEILDGGVSKGATVMSWRGTQGGIIAARRGNDVVMTPDGPLYLDWAQGDEDFEPLAICCVSTPQMIYDFNPTPAALTPDQAKHVLGVQGNMWTEYIPTADHLFYMLLPRAFAVAEDGWTPAADKRWSSFAERSRKQFARLEADGIPFRIPNPTARITGGESVVAENVHRSLNETELRPSAATGTVALDDLVPDAVIRYTTDDRLPTAKSARYTSPVAFDLDRTPVIHLRAVAVLPTGRTSAPTTITLRR